MNPGRDGCVTVTAADDPPFSTAFDVGLSLVT